VKKNKIFEPFFCGILKLKKRKGLDDVSVYKNEKRGTWYCIFRYKNFNGENIQKKKEGFALKREALAYENEYKRKMEGSCEMLFSELSDMYLADCAKRLKKSVAYQKKLYLEHVLNPYFGNMRINQISPIIVRNWQNDKMIGQYKQNTITNYCTLLNSVLNFAVKFYGLANNPVRAAGRIAYTSLKCVMHEEKIQIWDKNQFEKFAAKVEDPAMHLAYDILFFGGLRRGEVFGLRIKDVGNNTIRVRQNRVDYREHNGNIQTPKTTNSKRDVAMPLKIMQEIRRYIDLLYKPGEDDLLFSTSPNSLTNHFLHAQRQWDIEPKIRLHDLRHSHASLLIELGFSVQAIADRLGHANADQVIRTYGHLYPQKRDEIAEALNKL